MTKVDIPLNELERMINILRTEKCEVVSYDSNESVNSFRINIGIKRELIYCGDFIKFGESEKTEFWNFRASSIDSLIRDLLSGKLKQLNIRRQ